MADRAATDTLTRLSARLDAQEDELLALRATLARMRAAEACIPPRIAQAMPASPRRRNASRRALLKGAGAALFTTALLATGEVVPAAPFRVAAADPPVRPSGPGAAIATAADTLYQTFVGTDFQPEITAKGEIGSFAGISTKGAGPISPATTGAQNFSARLNLPQGATITEVLFFVFHDDAAAMSVLINGYDAADSNLTLIGNASVGTTNNLQTISVPITAAYATVDNTQQSYVLEWDPSNTLHELFGARVGYVLPGKAQVYGSAQAGIGVNGLAASGIGVQGQCDAASGIGVVGASATGVGLKGAATTGFPIIGQVVGPTINAGVLGVGTAGPGVQGQSTGGHGLVGTTFATDGQHAALIGSVQPGGNAIGLRGSIPPGATGLAGMFDGNVRITGTFVAPVQQTVAEHAGDNTLRLLHTMTSPEGWIEDFGKGTLAADKADIPLDPDFAALVHTDDYHVFLTAHAAQHLHIAQQSATGFSVVATAIGGAAGGPKPAEGGGTFSWRVVAKRKDIAGERLAKVAPPPPLQPVKAFTVPETPQPPVKKP